jgi:hypothetical protein
MNAAGNGSRRYALYVLCAIPFENALNVDRQILAILLEPIKAEPGASDHTGAFNGKDCRHVAIKPRWTAESQPS